VLIMNVVVHPRFGDTARVSVDEADRLQLVVELGGGLFVIQVDDEPGSTELAAQFADHLADAAVRVAERCRACLPGPVGLSPATGGAHDRI
jgi:hypothetical protein